jgi:hypothetical protein
VQRLVWRFLIRRRRDTFSTADCGGKMDHLEEIKRQGAFRFVASVFALLVGTCVLSVFAHVVANTWLNGRLRDEHKFAWEILILLEWSSFFILVVMIAGSALYVLRCRKPGLYGIAEICVGAYIAVEFALLHLGIMQELPNVAFSVLAALYIMVRGYDNIYRSFSASTLEIEFWNRIFFGKATDAKL